MIKSVITPDVPRTQVIIATLTHFDPKGCTNDIVTGTHSRRFARKKLIVHMIIKPIMVQITKENTLPRKILLYRRRILHFAIPSGRTWKTKTVNRVWLSALGVSILLGSHTGQKLTALKLKDGGTTCPEVVTRMWPPRLSRMQAVDGLTAISYILKIINERYRR